MPSKMPTEDRTLAQQRWADEVDWLLKQLRMSQVDLARALGGISEAVVSRWRNPDPTKGCLPTRTAQILFYEFGAKKGLYTRDSVDALRQRRPGR
jgi:hypothetical protein